MSWNMIGKPIATAEMGTTTVNQKVTSYNRMLMNGAQVGVIFYNNPAFNYLYLRMYANSSGSPGSLMATSVPYAKADLISLANGCKSVGFTFSAPVALSAGGIYYFTLYATAYSGDVNSHIAWRHSYPDPQYPTNVTQTVAAADNYPLEISLIGSSF